MFGVVQESVRLLQANTKSPLSTLAQDAGELYLVVCILTGVLIRRPCDVDRLLLTWKMKRIMQKEREGHVTMKGKIGVIELQVKEPQGWLVTISNWKRQGRSPSLELSERVQP